MGQDRPTTPDAPARPGPGDARESATAIAEPDAGPDPQLVEAELLVEDVSIDGMCGVY